MFLINSCSQLVSATDRRSRCSPFTPVSVPSPEVTAPFCPVPSPGFSQAPWYSLPDHLCRFRVRSHITCRLEAFPGSMAAATSVPLGTSPSRLSVYAPPDFPDSTTCTLGPGLPSPGSPGLLRPPFAVMQGTGMLTRFPSTTLFSLALGVDSPCPD